MSTAGLLNTQFRRCTNKSVVLLLLLACSTACCGAESIWNQLKVQGKSLDIMSLAKLADDFAIIGARHVEESWATESSPAAPALETVLVRKQLYVVRARPDGIVIWQRNYPALPDVQETFSTAATGDHRLCIVYGEQRRQDDVLNPVIVQIDATGKILWAKRNVISSLAANKNGAELNEQIANLDTLRVVGGPDGGCLLSFVTREYIGEIEKFRLHTNLYLASGKIRWRNSLESMLYGKQYLVHDIESRQFVVIQTNQSRDAAIQAMIAAVPFVPKTSIVGIGYGGKTLFQHHEMPALASVWIKDAANAKGEGVVLAGKTKSAWAGRLDRNGKLILSVDGIVGEYQAITMTNSHNYLFARGEHLNEVGDNLISHREMAIKEVGSLAYRNQSLLARLPSDLPVEQIISIDEQDYLLLYKLGGKLLKVRLKQ